MSKLFRRSVKILLSATAPALLLATMFWWQQILSALKPYGVGETQIFGSIALAAGSIVLGSCLYSGLSYKPKPEPDITDKK